MSVSRANMNKNNNIHTIFLMEFLFIFARETDIQTDKTDHNNTPTTTTTNNNNNNNNN